MSIGLIGKKCGMTRIFTESGQSIPVTVIQVMENRISQIKTVKTDGYDAVQIAAGSQHPGRLNKAQHGHLKKAGIEACQSLKEFRVTSDILDGLKLGDTFTVDHFTVGQHVDVRGLTRGKGFAGSIKRWNFGMQDATHGNSISHRHLGSVGQCQDPGRVFKGKKMAGHMGNVFRTSRNQEIIKIDAQKQVILVKGSIPGAPNSTMLITLSKKTKGEC